MNYQPRLRGQYKSEIVPALMEEFHYKSVMQVPRLLKISLNQGIGAALADKKLIDYGVEEMSAPYLPFPSTTSVTSNCVVATRSAFT